MGGFADYERYDALGLADLVRRKEARNQAVNAVVMPLYDYGRQAIADGLPDGPFRGVSTSQFRLASSPTELTQTSEKPP